MTYFVSGLLLVCLHVVYGTLGACGKLGGYRLPAWPDFIVMFTLCAAAFCCFLLGMGAL